MGRSDRRLASALLAAIGLLPEVAGAAPAGGRALAYVDPGAGSFILQALVAALAGIVVTVNVYWRKIKSFLGFGSQPTDADGSPPFDSTDD